MGRRTPSLLPSLNWGPELPDNLKRFWDESRDLQAGEDNDHGDKGTSTKGNFISLIRVGFES